MLPVCGATLPVMKISADDIALLDAACRDPRNARAQELVNVLGTTSVEEILAQINALPPDLQSDLEKYAREAIDEQKRRIRPR